MYRQIGLAMGYVGQGNQCPLKRPVLAFVRAAFPDGNGIPGGTDVPPMSESEAAAYSGDTAEPNPTDAAVAAFVAVLGRIYG